MEAYDNLLTVVQSLATGAYHTDRGEGGKHYRPELDIAPDYIHDRIILPVKAMVQEIENRFNNLAILEMSQDPTAANHMRSLVWAMAAHELRVYAEGDFSFEPIETRVPEEFPEEAPGSPYTPVADAILEYFRKTSTRLTPHFVYDVSTGTVTSLYRAPRQEAPGKDPEEPSRTSGHTKWVSTSTPGERERRGRLAMFGQVLWTFRKANSFKRGELAHVLGVTKETLVALEYGELDTVEEEPLCQEHPFVHRMAENFGILPAMLWPWADTIPTSDSDSDKEN